MILEPIHQKTKKSTKIWPSFEENPDSPENPAMIFQPSEVKKMSTREKVMGAEEDMLPKTFKGNPPKCHNCGVIGHTEKWG